MNVVYASYDGALDPLGASQVLPYVIGLARRSVGITLITFEKRERWIRAETREATRDRLRSEGIVWRPLPYHKSPRLPATLFDIVAGSRVIAREATRVGAALVHCRGEVATAMARWARLPTIPILYDMRGFFADERVDGGSWSRGSVTDRLVRRLEADNLQRASGLVVLTDHAAQILERRRAVLPPLRVIPTCVDVSLFRPCEAAYPPAYGLVYSGSLGTWYMAEEMFSFAASCRDTIPGRVLFLTCDVDEARRRGREPAWADIRGVEPAAVSSWLRKARASFFFIKPVPSKRASFPTKFAEALGCGLPVVCNRGIGDLDDIVERENVGVLVDGFSATDYSIAAVKLRALLQDTQLSERCRKLAEAKYSLEFGVTAYRGLYEELVTHAMFGRAGARAGGS